MKLEYKQPDMERNFNDNELNLYLFNWNLKD
jgi:hypothetical protein